MAIVVWTEVFRKPEFTGAELDRMLEAARGKTVHFPDPAVQAWNQTRKDSLIEEYAKGGKADELAERFGVSRRTVFNTVAEERARMFAERGHDPDRRHVGSCPQPAERVRFWRDRGLSWRQIGRLYKMSHEGVRKMAEGA